MANKRDTPNTVDIKPVNPVASYTPTEQDVMASNKANATSAFNTFVGNLQNPYTNELNFGFDQMTGQFNPTTQGMMTGLGLSKAITGSNIFDIGNQAKEVSDKYYSMMNSSPLSGDRAAKASQDKMARANAKAGMSGLDLTAADIQNTRNASFEAALANKAESRSALDAFAKNLNARAGTTLSTMYGQQALELGQTPSDVPSYSSGMSVICTQLHISGLMPDHIAAKDELYGIKIRQERPEIYIGYRFFADPIVKLMKISPLFTRLVSIPALCWARNMAGERDLIGKLISKAGEPICGIVGKIIGANREQKRA